MVTICDDWWVRAGEIDPTAWPTLSIAASGSNIHAVWHDDRDVGPTEIYYKNSEDNGVSWDSDIRITNAPGRSWRPDVAAYGKNVHIVWTDERDGNFEIYYEYRYE